MKQKNVWLISRLVLGNKKIFENLNLIMFAFKIFIKCDYEFDDNQALKQIDVLRNNLSNGISNCKTVKHKVVYKNFIETTIAKLNQVINYDNTCSSTCNRSTTCKENKSNCLCRIVGNIIGIDNLCTSKCPCTLYSCTNRDEFEKASLKKKKKNQTDGKILY